MSFNESLANKRCEGESISSWLFRLQCHAHKYHRVSDVDLIPPGHSHASCLLDAGLQFGSGRPQDFDQGLTPASSQAITDQTASSFNTPLPRVGTAAGDDKPFDELYGHAERPTGAPWLGTVIIPLHHRCSYCYQCLEEGIRTTGLPVAHTCWRHVLMPFCLRHKALLYDVSERVSSDVDFPAAIFKFHWNRAYAISRLDEHARSDVDRHKDAMEVQERLEKLWNNTADESLRTANLGFILTLFRMVLQPTFKWAYTKHDMFNLQGQLPKGGFYSSFYQLPLCATATARARALYLVGLILGWIDERGKQANVVWDAFAPSCASDIWAGLSHCGPLRGWVRRELDLYGTNNLSRGSLRDTPCGW